MKIKVYATPALIQEDLADATTIVIDALRMTTVASVAMANGCAGIKAAEDVDAARLLAAEAGALLGGERGALPIDGFDFGNSPLSYTKGAVAGKRLVMTTSNGTRAIAAAWASRRVLLGAFVNAGAAAVAVREEPLLCIVCAGTLGAFTLEDALAAGAILDRLEGFGVPVEPDDMGIACGLLYAKARQDLHAVLSRTAHYRRLQSLGMMEDLRFCLSEDTVTAVPERMADGWFA